MHACGNCLVAVLRRCLGNVSSTITLYGISSYVFNLRNFPRRGILVKIFTMTRRLPVQTASEEVANLEMEHDVESISLGLAPKLLPVAIMFRNSVPGVSVVRAEIRLYTKCLPVSVKVTPMGSNTPVNPMQVNYAYLMKCYALTIFSGFPRSLRMMTPPPLNKATVTGLQT